MQQPHASTSVLRNGHISSGRPSFEQEKSGDKEPQNEACAPF